MPTRIELHTKLIEVTKLDSKRVYYQPPSNIHLVYPCLIYSQDTPSVLPADNKVSYKLNKKYSITYITKEADSDIIDRMLENFQLISADRPFISDDLYHYPFTLFY